MRRDKQCANCKKPIPSNKWCCDECFPYFDGERFLDPEECGIVVGMDLRTITEDQVKITLIRGEAVVRGDLAFGTLVLSGTSSEVESPRQFTKLESLLLAYIEGVADAIEDEGMRFWAENIKREVSDLVAATNPAGIATIPTAEAMTVPKAKTS